VSEMNRTPDTPESLGAFLSRVRPGDSCSCCGATLQGSVRIVEGADPPSATCAVRLAVLAACPECGCEICEEVGPETGAAWSRLSPAA
jgi:hypothetical protein